jgi:hypothetical protein
MGLMDRVKAQAAQIAQQAQEAAQEGRARIDQVQAGRRGDVMLRQLGAAVLAERTGRGAADSQARIEQLINEITAYERESGLNLTSPPPQPGVPAGTPGPFGGQQQTAPGGAGAPFPGTAGSSFPDPGGASFPGQAGPPPGSAPTIDTMTSFFPTPGDDQ